MLRRRCGSSVPLAVGAVIILFLLVLMFFGLLRQGVADERRLTLGLRADAIASAGVHVAMSCLRRSSTFREPIRGRLDGGTYEVTIEDARQEDRPETIWVLEDQYLLVRATARVEEVERTVEALLNRRSLFTEFGIVNLATDTIPYAAPAGHPDLRDPTVPWDAAAMARWAHPGAPNPDAATNGTTYNRHANRGYRKGEAPAWGGGDMTGGGPVYVQEWLTLHDAVLPIGVHCGSYIIVQPDAVGAAMLDLSDPNGRPRLPGEPDKLPIYTSDAVAREDKSGSYLEADTLSKRYPDGHPRILDRDSFDGGGRLEVPEIDWDYLRALAKEKGIYIAANGQVQMGFRGERTPSNAHAALYPVSQEELYGNSGWMGKEGTYQGGRWSQLMIAGTFVDVGKPARHPEVADRGKNALHADNLPDGGLIFSDCNVRIQGPVGRAVSVYVHANAIVEGDLNVPQTGRQDSVPFALITGLRATTQRVPGWSLDVNPPGGGALKAEAGWMNFSVARREGPYTARRGRKAEDTLGYLTSGTPDHFDLAGVYVMQGGAFLDGYKWDPANPKARRVSGAEREVIAGGETVEGDGNDDPAVNYTRAYDLDFHGSFVSNWGTHCEGGQSSASRKNFNYDMRLLRQPPPHLPISVNIVRWRRTGS